MRKLKMIANKGLLQIFFALLLVAIIMFVSNYLVYRNSISGIYRQVSENNKLVVKNMIRVFDDSFKNINNVIYSIQMLPYNPWKSIDEGKMDMADAYMTHTNIRALVSSIDYIKEVIVFHQGSDLAITQSGTIQLPELLRLSYDSTAYSAHFWKSLADVKHPLRVFPAHWYNETSARFEQGRKLIPVLGSNQLSNLNVLVFLDNDKLLQHVNQGAMAKGTSLIVMDQDRNVILNTEEKWDLVQMLTELNFGAASETTLKSNNFEYTMFKSDYNGFVYINKAPYRFADLNAVTDVNKQIMLVAIACAVILSALLSLYLYRPVRHLLKLVGRSEQKGYDYRNIRTGIVKMQEENESFKTEMDLIRSEMRKAAFVNALQDSSWSKETEQRLKRYFSEFFIHDYFMLASLHAAASLEAQPAGEGEEAIANGAEDSIRAGLQSRLDHVIVFALPQGRFLLFIGLQRAADREYAVKQLRGFVRQAQEEQGKEESLHALVSRAYKADAANCPKAYQELAECFLHQDMRQDDIVTDWQTIRYNWKIRLPLDELEKASHFIKVGNMEECIRIIDGILTDNANRGIHRHQLVSIAKTIFYSMLHQLEACDPDSNDAAQMELQFNKTMEAAPGLKEIRSELVRTARYVADVAKQGSKSKLDPATIARYIERNYMGNLHLDHMAEQLETSPKYFSNYFKKTFGVNFVEYLNKVRLANAKEMLRNTELSVAEIGDKIGYLNSSTFTSTFKKYYGISPSEYRKNAQAEAAASYRKKG